MKHTLLAFALLLACVLPGCGQRAVVAAETTPAAETAKTPEGFNVLTPEEPTDWAGGSGFYDAFVDVRSQQPQAP